MKTVQASVTGDADVLHVVDVPVPAPAPGEVLIRVESAPVNYSDLHRRSGRLYPFPTDFPYTPGAEVAGTVHAVGDDTAAPPVGTPVFALVGADGSGGYAQYALAAAEQVIPIPEGVGFDQAASLVVAGSTASLALFDAGRLAEGETVLVQAAGGGVGTFAIQLARQAGATVIATASTPERRAAATALGAHAAIDSADGWAEHVMDFTDGRGVDLMLESTGGPGFGAVLSVLAPFGRVVVLGSATGTPLELAPDEIARTFYAPAPNHSLIAFNLGLYFRYRPAAAVAALGDVIGRVARREVEVQIGETFPLDAAADAHRLIEHRRSTGKVILKPWQGS